ncbi:MAG: glutathione S-transferase family protein [Elstera sp.]
MTDAPLTLVSFDLCPYVQRAAIVLAEKGVPFARKTIDLANKPDWFKALSPLGKVPLLQVGESVLFESAAIVEYLDETHGPRLHPSDPLTRAQHRGWMELGSSILADIWGLETTPDAAVFAAKAAAIREKFTRVEDVLGSGPYFSGVEFSIVDAVFAPIFRYFDVFDTLQDLSIFNGLAKVEAWRRTLAARPSVIGAVVPDYSERLLAFLNRHNGCMVQGARV